MKKAVVLLAALGIVFLLLLSGCGKSLFAPFTTSGVLINPELALERADYLYLGGNVEEADEVYVALMEEYADDEEYLDVYLNAVRGHSKCTLEVDPESSSDALISFINFAMSVDTETFSLDEEGETSRDEFEEHAATFKEAVWDSFVILTVIPVENRTESDYGNMSISGLFTVCVDFLTLMVTTVDATTNIMEKMEELSTQVDEFNTKWSEAELTSGTNPATWAAGIQDEIQAIAVNIDIVYTEIETVLISVEETMELLQLEGEEVTTETAGATNALTLMLNEVFVVILEVVDSTLTVLQDMQDITSEFYLNLQDALSW